MRYDLNTIIGKETDIKTIRNTTIIILIVSFILSTLFDRALYYWYYFGTYVIVSTFFPLICALFDIKIKNIAIMMRSGISITLLWDILILLEIVTLPSIYIGLLVGIIILFWKIKGYN